MTWRQLLKAWLGANPHDRHNPATDPTSPATRLSNLVASNGRPSEQWKGRPRVACRETSASKSQYWPVLIFIRGTNCFGESELAVTDSMIRSDNKTCSELYAACQPLEYLEATRMAIQNGY